MGEFELVKLIFRTTLSTGIRKSAPFVRIQCSIGVVWLGIVDLHKLLLASPFGLLLTNLDTMDIGSVGSRRWWRIIWMGDRRLSAAGWEMPAMGMSILFFLVISVVIVVRMPSIIVVVPIGPVGIVIVRFGTLMVEWSRMGFL
jgi:hypothetical protein